MLPLKCLLAGLLVIVAACQAQPKADLIIYGGTIHTGNPDNPRVDMVVVKDGKIAFAGPKAELENWQAPNTRLLNLAGKTMTSGLIESHGHFLSMGYARMQVDLNDTRNYEEMIERVVEAAQTIPPGEWILGRGWHQSKWSPQPEKMVGGFQTHDKLSAAVPDHPVFLRHASGHAAIANAKRWRFSKGSIDKQCGTITYNFKVQ